MCRAICSICLLLLLGALVCCARDINLPPNLGFERADRQQVALWAKRTPDDGEYCRIVAARRALPGRPSRL